MDTQPNTARLATPKTWLLVLAIVFAFIAIPTQSSLCIGPFCEAQTTQQPVEQLVADEITVSSQGLLKAPLPATAVQLTDAAGS